MRGREERELVDKEGKSSIKATKNWLFCSFSFHAFLSSLYSDLICISCETFSFSFFAPCYFPSFQNHGVLWEAVSVHQLVMPVGIT